MYVLKTYSSPHQRLCHSSCVINNKMWMYGGVSVTKPRKCLGDVWTYSLDTSKWNKVVFNADPDKPTNFVPHPLVYHTMTPVFSKKVLNPDSTLKSFSITRYEKLNV